MLDNCKLVGQYQRKADFENVLSGSDMLYRESKINEHTGQRFEIFDFGSLTLVANPQENRVTIKNSLTTFLKGNNYTNLTYSDLLFVVDVLSDAMHLQRCELKFSNLEFAVNVETPLAPYEYFSRFISLRQSPFYFLSPPPGFSKPLEKMCSLQQYNVKFYDTAKWHKLFGINLLKSEIVFKRMEKVAGVLKCAKRQPITLADLIEKPNLEALGNHKWTTSN